MTDAYMICIRVDDTFDEYTPTYKLRQAIALTLQQHDVAPGTGVTLLVTTDDAVHKLNRQFLGIDAPTDVLSFPASDEQELTGSVEDPYLGDILIAYPYTAEHAVEDGHEVKDVLVLLAVHGTLHLLGYDHDKADNESLMWAQQEDLLKQLGVPPAVLPPKYNSPLEDVG